MQLDVAEGWRPEEGDTIVGHVTAIDAGWSDWTNSYYPIVTIQPLDESLPPVAVHGFHQTLRTKFAQLRPEVGDKIGVKFVRKQPTKDGKRSVAIYGVRVEGKSAKSLWDTTLAEPQDSRQQQQMTTSDIPSDIPAQKSQQSDDDIPF